MASLFAWLMHLDTHLASFAAEHGVLIYALLFAIIFIETGVVIMPFLPGDSLLFVAGALAADGQLNIALLFAMLSAAAIAGDTVNFSLGSLARRRTIDRNKMPFLSPAHLQRTRDFFTRHGNKAIVLARFVPVVRTLAPFVAALGQMHYATFLRYNIVGGLLWVGALLAAGYLFGNVPWIHDHLTAVLLGVVVISILPGVLGWARTRKTRSHGAPGL